jgi:hypothetical protein
MLTSMVQRSMVGFPFHLPKGISMDYELLIYRENESREVSIVPADSIAEAVAIAERDPDVVSVVLLAAIDREPIAPLVRFAS